MKFRQPSQDWVGRGTGDVARFFLVCGSGMDPLVRWIMEIVQVPLEIALIILGHIPVRRRLPLHIPPWYVTSHVNTRFIMNDGSMNARPKRDRRRF